MLIRFVLLVASLFMFNQAFASESDPTNNCQIICLEKYAHCIELYRHEKVELGEKAINKECAQARVNCFARCEFKQQ